MTHYYENQYRSELHLNPVYNRHNMGCFRDWLMEDSDNERDFWASRKSAMKHIINGDLTRDEALAYLAVDFGIQIIVVKFYL